MKTLTILTLLLASVGIASAVQSFTPSHALAAKLRFAAINAGETYIDHTPALPILDEEGREWYQSQEAERTENRLAALEAEYEKQLTTHLESQQPSTDEGLIARIDKLEKLLVAAHTDMLAQAAAAKAEQDKPVEVIKPVTPPETIVAPDDEIDLKAAVIGGGVVSAAGLGLAGTGMMLRRRRSAEIDTDSDTGFDS